LVGVFSLEEGESPDSVSGANFVDWRDRSSSFQGFAGYVGASATLVEGDQPMRIRGVSVTPEFFSVLGVEAAMGRVFSPGQDAPGGESVVVVGNAFWREHLGGEKDVLGRRLELNNELFTVVGVLPPGFDYPAGTALWTAARFRVPDPPVNLGEDPALDRGGEYIDVIARLREGISLEAAQAEMDAVAQQLEEEYPDSNWAEGIALIPLKETLVAEARPLLLVLLSAVAFVLLIACANVAHLHLVRATRREREIAVRQALGAGRGRLARQLVIESVLLPRAGGALGTALASQGAAALLALAPDGIPRAAEVGLDLRVLLVSALMVLGTGVLFGLAPVPQLFRRDSYRAMREGRGGQTATRGGHQLRKGLVVAQVAVSLLLLVGSGLMVRTFLSLLHVEAGFECEQSLAAHLTLPRASYNEDGQLRMFHRDLMAQLRAIPGVESAGTVLTLPLHWSIRGNLVFSMRDQPKPEGQEVGGGFQVVSLDYFQTLGIPLIRGRVFEESDSEESAPVALINETLARIHWPDEDPLGKQVCWGGPSEDDSDWMTVVGVVGDTHVDGLDIDPRPEIYMPYQQAPARHMSVVVRAAPGVEVATLGPLLRRAVMSVDPHQPVHGLVTMEEALSRSLAPRQFNMLLMVVFAAAALLLAAIGLYGVLSFSVAQRSHEIGIRRALGAQGWDVVGQVLGEASLLVASGLGLGVVASLALARLLSGLVYGVVVTDPASYAAGVAVLILVALGAAFLPAVRASRVDPMVALRAE
jgi:putative ABC transport system permease protein